MHLFRIFLLINGLLFCCPVLFAQYQSIYNEKGELKTIGERKYDEDQKKRIQYDPVPGQTPAQNANTPVKLKLSPEEEAIKKAKIEWNSQKQAKAYQQSLVFQYNPLAMSEGLTTAKQHNKYGFVDKNGNIVLPLIYDDAHNFVNGIAMVKSGNSWGSVDKSGKFIIPPVYESSIYFYEGLAAVKKAYKPYGYINMKGEVVLPAIYEVAKDFSEGLAAVSIKADPGKGYDPTNINHVRLFRSTWGFIDKSGTVVIKPQFLHSHSFSEGLAAVCKVDKWGYINKEGEMVIPGKYTYCYDFKNGLSMASIGKFYGFINTKGQEVIPIEFDYMADFENGRVRGILDKVDYFFDAQGRQVGGEKVFVPKVPLEIRNKPYYASRKKLSNGLTLIELDGKYGLMDQNETILAPMEYDEPFEFANSMALVIKDDLKGYIDVSGRLVINPVYISARNFSEGLAPVLGKLANGSYKWGYIDTQGKVVIPMIYDDARIFSEDRACVSLDQYHQPAYGFINKQGSLVIPYTYPEGWATFKNGVASIRMGYESDKDGLIDKDGKTLLPFKYSFSEFLPNGTIILAKNGKYGILSSDYKVKVPFKYDKMTLLKTGIKATYKGKTVNFDLLGNEI